MGGLEPERIKLFLRKYAAAWIVLLVGMAFMILPDKKQVQESEEWSNPITEQISLQDSLSDILSEIDGAGKVRVLLSKATGEEIHFQTNEDLSQDQDSLDRRLDTVMVTDGKRDQQGLIRRVDSPVYQGAVVLCQGADSAAIRLAIVDAIANTTGLTSDHITVLKMK